MNPNIVELVENVRLKIILILDSQSKLLLDVGPDNWKIMVIRCIAVLIVSYLDNEHIHTPPLQMDK